LVYNTHSYDPAGDDNDVYPEGGESIALLVDLYNTGNGTASNISVQLTCQDADITITDNTTSYLDIPAESEMWSTGHLNFDIDPECIERDVEFVLKITSDEGEWTSPFLIHIFPANDDFAPFLLYNTHLFNPAGEDNDGLAEGGESIKILIDIYNSGLITANNVSAVLSCADADITITDAEESYSDIHPDEEEWCNYSFDFDISTNITERDVEFLLKITADEGEWISPFLVHIYAGASAINEYAQLINIAYPNPSNGIFKLQSSDLNGNYHYQILDMSGSIVYSDEIVFSQGQEILMELNWLKAGIYFLEIENDDETSIQKLIIQ